jgi:hypothetical protein
MTGTVLSGTTPIVGATVKAWTTGITATQLGTTLGVPASAVTDANGQFSLIFTCPTAGTLTYVTATGGKVGSAAVNASIQLVNAVGALPTCGTTAPDIVINELTSTAAAYALSGFTAPAGTASAVSFQGKSPGLNQAYVTLTNLVVPATGVFANTLRVQNNDTVQRRLNTVANAMAACDATTSGGACAELFSCASANATYVSAGQPCTGGTTPTSDTLNAALAITQNAGLVNMQGVYEVASLTTAFTPALAAQPSEWSLPLVFTVANHGPLAIDAGGHVWLLGPDPNPAPSPATLNLAVAEMDADGTFLSPHRTGHDWSGGGVSSIPDDDKTNLAIDQSGNVWVGGTGHTIAVLSSSGSGAPGAPFSADTGPDHTAAVTIDSGGNAWFASGDTAPSIFELTYNGSVGTNISGAGGYTAGNCPCDGMAADASGNMWVVSSGMNQYIAQLDSTGHQGNIVPPPNGYSVTTFTAIAADASGVLWIADQHNHGIWKFTPAGDSGAYSPTPFNNNAAQGTKPKAIAVDGAGHKWVANNPTSNASYPSITEFSVDGTTNLSPTDGFGFGVVGALGGGAYALAVDGSGNVWVTNTGTSITEYVGAAAPTKNPISKAVSTGSFVP